MAESIQKQIDILLGDLSNNTTGLFLKRKEFIDILSYMREALRVNNTFIQANSGVLDHAASDYALLVAIAEGYGEIKPDISDYGINISNIFSGIKGIPREALVDRIENLPTKNSFSCLFFDNEGRSSVPPTDPFIVRYRHEDENGVVDRDEVASIVQDPVANQTLSVSASVFEIVIGGDAETATDSLWQPSTEYRFSEEPNAPENVAVLLSTGEILSLVAPGVSASTEPEISNPVQFEDVEDGGAQWILVKPSSWRYKVPADAILSGIKVAKYRRPADDSDADIKVEDIASTSGILDAGEKIVSFSYTGRLAENEYISVEYTLLENEADFLAGGFKKQRLKIGTLSKGYVIEAFRTGIGHDILGNLSSPPQIPIKYTNSDPTIYNGYSAWPTDKPDIHGRYKKGYFEVFAYNGSGREWNFRVRFSTYAAEDGGFIKDAEVPNSVSQGLFDNLDPISFYAPGTEYGTLNKLLSSSGYEIEVSQTGIGYGIFGNLSLPPQIPIKYDSPDSTIYNGYSAWGS